MRQVPYIEKVRAQQGSGCYDPLKTGMVNEMKAILISLITLILLGSGLAHAQGTYTSSAHGGANGVVRWDPSETNPFPDYVVGHCAHCHVKGKGVKSALDSLFSKWHEISMSMPLRIQYSGAWYHVMNRGRRQEIVFSEQRDCLAFIHVLKEAVDMSSCH